MTRRGGDTSPDVARGLTKRRVSGHRPVGQRPKGVQRGRQPDEHDLSVKKGRTRG